MIGAQGINLGMFGNFMTSLGLWDNGAPNTNVTATYLGTFATSAQNMSTIQQFVNGQQTNFQSIIENISGAGRSSCQTNCYLNVGLNQETALLSTNKSLYTALLSAVQLSQNQQTNLITLFDPYNSTLSAIFQQSAYALNDAFEMEYIINQLNYYNAVNYLNNQICTSPATITNLNSLSNTPSTHYSYSGENSIAQININYNNAQKQLALFYAALENQLYQNIVNYIVSDIPVQGQSWPTTTQQITMKNGQVITDSNILPYSKIVGTKVTTPMNFIPNNLTNSQTSWVSNTVFYQYSGLQNMSVCANTVYSQSSGASSLASLLNSNNCPAIFTDINGNPVGPVTGQTTPSSQFNWATTIVPYYVSAKPQLAQTVTQLINNCNSSAITSSSGTTILPPYNFYWYFPGNYSPMYNNGQPVFMCGNWPEVTNSFNGNGATYPLSDFNVSLWGMAPLMYNPSTVNFSISNNSTAFTLTSNDNLWTNSLGPVTFLSPVNNYSAIEEITNFSYSTLQYTASDGFIGSIIVGGGVIAIPSGIVEGTCGFDLYSGQYIPCFFVNANINPALSNVQFQNSSGQIVPLNSQNGSALTYQNSGYGNYTAGSGNSFFNYSQNGNNISYTTNYAKNYYGPSSTQISIVNLEIKRQNI